MISTYTWARRGLLLRSKGPEGYLIPDNIKREFFQAVAMSALLYGCTTLTKFLEEKELDRNYSMILHSLLNWFKKQHPTKQQPYDNLLPILPTIQVRRKRHVEHYWRSENELISDVFRWTSTKGHTSFDQLAKTYIDQLCVEAGCYQEDFIRAMADRTDDIVCVCVCVWERERESTEFVLLARIDDDDIAFII